MSELRFETWTMPAARLGPPNPLPFFDRYPRRQYDLDNLPEDLKHLGHGIDISVLPYRLQDDFNRTRKPREFRAAVLENDILRATFLMEVGGRLWSLVHKPSGRELLYVNPIFQPVNIGVRKAWVSGGVEWNMGIRGHSPYTVSPIFIARTSTDDGQPVLRMYEWERIRGAPYQIDAYLPDGSSFLRVRVRLVNPNDTEIPMYWWSNIAIPQADDTRVIVPADSCYMHSYDKTGLVTVSVPLADGLDMSRPSLAPRAGDMFFRIAGGVRPWICALDASGRGLVQTSTALLRGRKLFKWGRGPGGQFWQNFLSLPDHPYAEIQAGLTTTQSQCLPMAAGAQWQWLEAYGLMEADADEAQGDNWHKAQGAVSIRLGEQLPADVLEAELTATEAMARRAPMEIIQTGSGWAALQRRRMAANGEAWRVGPATPFGDESLGDDQKPWLELLESGALPTRSPDDNPGAYVVDPRWRELLAEAVSTGRCAHWLSHLHLGVMNYHADNLDRAAVHWEKSLELAPSVWAYRNLAVLASRRDRPDKAAELYADACAIKRGWRPLAMEYCKALLDADMARQLLEFVASQKAEFRTLGRMQFLEATARVRLGQYDQAEHILRNLTELQGVREGETGPADLWFDLHARRIALGENIPLDEALRSRVMREFPPPDKIDFRMHATGGAKAL